MVTTSCLTICLHLSLPQHLNLMSLADFSLSINLAAQLNTMGTGQIDLLMTYLLISLSLSLSLSQRQKAHGQQNPNPKDDKSKRKEKKKMENVFSLYYSLFICSMFIAHCIFLISILLHRNTWAPSFLVCHPFYFLIFRSLKKKKIFIRREETSRPNLLHLTESGKMYQRWWLGISWWVFQADGLYII